MTTYQEQKQYTQTPESPFSPSRINKLQLPYRRNKKELEKRSWTLTSIWIKVHVADKLAKEAARKNEIAFNRSPKNEIAQQIRDQSIVKWQRQWDHNTRGLTTKQFFPFIKDRLTTKIKLAPNFTARKIAHGKTKAYLQRFKIIVSSLPLRRREPNC
jgi:hypothetical protein